MSRCPWLILPLAVVATGCAGQRPKAPLAATSTSVSAAPGAATASTETVSSTEAAARHRQYFDKRRRRFYYFDPGVKQYFWENGEPKT